MQLFETISASNWIHQDIVELMELSILCDKKTITYLLSTLTKIQKHKNFLIFSSYLTYYIQACLQEY